MLRSLKYRDLHVSLQLVILTFITCSSAFRNKGCVVQGHLFTHLSWYGYLAQKTFRENNGRIQYEFVFPLDSSPRLLIYHDEQISQLKPGMSCQQRESILPKSNHQIIHLKPNHTRGCTVASDTEGPFVYCTGERNFSSRTPKTWYFVLSRCLDTRLLNIWYHLNLTGYYGDCEVDPLARTVIPEVSILGTRYLYIIIVLGVFALLSLLILCVFIWLWCKLKRRFGGCGQHDKNSQDSLTSSQATMTQDIFFVNSVSTPTTMASVLRTRDRDTSDYSRSSSENYYEVISSERRALENANRNGVLPHANRVPHSNGSHYASRSLVGDNGCHVTFRHHINSPFTMTSRFSDTSHLSGLSNYQTRQRYPMIQSLTSAPPELTNENYPPPPYQMDTFVRSSYPYPQFVPPITTPTDRQRLVASLPPANPVHLLRPQNIQFDEVAETLA